MSGQKTIVIANWKMKLDVDQSVALARELKHIRSANVEAVICPSFVALSEVGAVLRRGAAALGAQDVFWEDEGAFTGEISARDLRSLGCRYVIVGHSERRMNMGETDQMVHQKVVAALRAELTPIVCVGETYEQRQKGGQDYVIITQVTKALEGIQLAARQQIVVAYEPVWVIGSGQAINPEQAGAVHQVIRQTLIDLFPLELVNNNIRIIYGGSVDSENVGLFTGLPNTAGVLVGSASLQSATFKAIIDAV